MVWTSNLRPVFVGLLMLQYHDASESLMCLEPETARLVEILLINFSLLQERVLPIHVRITKPQGHLHYLSWHMLHLQVDRSSDCYTSLCAVSTRIHLVLVVQLTNVLSLSTDGSHVLPRFSIVIDVSATSTSWPYCRRAGMSIYLHQFFKSSISLTLHIIWRKEATETESISGLPGNLLMLWNCSF